MKAFLRLVLTLVCIQMMWVIAQPTPEPTPESTPEMTPEATAEMTPEAGDSACPRLVRSAIDLTQNRCETVNSNQVCYGHSILEAASRPGFEDFNFEEPGDIEDVIEMQSLNLSPMDLNEGVWGVILMRVQAEIEGENDDVQVIVFGDANLESPTPILEVNVTANANVRALPDETAELIAILVEDSRIIANGRSQDDEWLRVQLPTETEPPFGWISQALIAPNPELETLEVIADEDLEEALVYRPMQAFYFQSGVDDAPCEAAPNSGMMIQTPEGEAKVTLWIDEVIIELDATAFVQAQPNGELSIDVLEGTVTITANGETRTAVAGTQITVPLDNELGVAGVPNDPQPLDPADLQGLPIDLLDTPVEIPAPLDLPPGTPIAGNWTFRWGVTEQTCPDGQTIPFESSGIPFPITVGAQGETLQWGGGTYTRIETGVYSRSYVDTNGNLYQDTLNVIALDRMSGESVIDLAATLCTLTVPFNLQLVSGS